MLTEEQVFAQASSVKTEAPKTDELEVLFEGPKIYKINGEDITIRPFTFGELPKVIGLLKGVGGTFAHLQATGQISSIEGIMSLVDVGGEQLISTLAINIGKPRAWFDTIPSDAGIELLIDFLKMNIGFFTKRVVPILQGLK